jgi:type II secretory pathway predicted ATPase ExeA
MTFKGFYQFSFNPFDKQDLKEKDAFQSVDHKEMLNRLDFIKDSGGIGVFTAAPGFGKTYTLRCFVHPLNPQLYRVLYICMSTVSVIDFYRQLCMELNLDVSNKKSTMFRTIQERLLSNMREHRAHYIIVIDEAHHLDTAILSDIKMLMNFQMDAVYPFTLVLVGEPYLNRILDKGVHDALRQRIAVHYDFCGLCRDEIEEYLRHKFAIAGSSFDILGEGVLSAIEASCKNNPRLIDNLMIQALTIGAQNSMQTINTDVILAASNSMAL